MELSCRLIAPDCGPSPLIELWSGDLLLSNRPRMGEELPLPAGLPSDGVDGVRTTDALWVLPGISLGGRGVSAGAPG